MLKAVTQLVMPGVVTEDEAEVAGHLADMGLDTPRATAQVRYQDGLPDKLYGLEDLSVRSAGGDWVSSGTRRHTLADTVPVYVRQGGEWYLSDWSLVRDTEVYSLTAWYDRADDQGGRVRLITAVPRSG